MDRVGLERHNKCIFRVGIQGYRLSRSYTHVFRVWVTVGKSY